MVLGWAAASGHFVKGGAERNHFVTSFGVIMFSDMGSQGARSLRAQGAPGSAPTALALRVSNFEKRGQRRD